ncbi:ATP-binding protein [Salimicrobium sp. PL1-032A]|uniref:sensor histidine kinase n=1 Tax=Salimicrobium sp. PL1-032A TaxID=3095364 RepID=UPI003261A634
MADHSPAERSLDVIVQELVSRVSKSRDEVFAISEKSRKEYGILTEEMEHLKTRVEPYIKKGEDFEGQEKPSGQPPASVIRHFHQDPGEERRKTSGKTDQISITEEKEKQFKTRMENLERRLRELVETIGKAENLAVTISVVLNYLSEDFHTASNTHGDPLQVGVKILAAKEEERRRLSREIHDGPAQMLANVLLRSDLVERTLKERGVQEAVAEMKSLRDMVRSSLHEVRRIIYDLHPVALDELQIVPALRKYLTTVSEDHQFDIRFRLFGEERRLTSDYEVAVFRLVQEAVQNARKHAEAERIDVRFEWTPGSIIIVIKDDGKGFDLRDKHEDSFGLFGMRERVELLNGYFNIDSSLGSGTSVTIKLPLPK